ncbi:MAG: 50S ribosomal protein L24 [Firmicutes bacterium]|nr:50S ribosomal protein L24 [Bacillota bacterium]
MLKPKVKPKIHVRKGDTVLVICGKSAGKKGKVLEVRPADSRVIVEGVNKVKRHTKPTRSLPQGGIMEREAPLHSSNVMLFCTKCNKPTRVGKKIQEDGKSLRQCKNCGELFS